MKKNITKVVSLVLAFMLLIGAAVIVSVSANDAAQTVEIVSNNVYYGETLQLMYAVKAPVLNNGDELKVTLYFDEACTQKFCDAEQNGTASVDGTTCYVFYASKGVPAQDINLNVYAKAEIVNGDNTVCSDVQSYSVLEYLNERLYVSNGVTDAQKAMYNTLIDFAKAAETVIYANATNRLSRPIAGYNYVTVTDGTIDGANNAGMYANGSTPFAGVTSTLTLTATQYVLWTVTNLDDGTHAVYTTEELQTLALTANVSIVPTVADSASTNVTIAEALKLADTTPVIVSGTVVSIDTAWSDSYNNISVTISDGNNSLAVYRLATHVYLGDTITVTGEMGSYNGTRQIAANATAEITANHVCANYATDANCLTPSECTSCGAVLGSALGHTAPNANGCCERCGFNVNATFLEESLAIAATTGAFASDSLSISWTADHFTVLAEKDASTTAIRVTDTDHYRCYKSSKLTISSNNGKSITKIVVTCTSGSYATAMANSLTTAGVTAVVNGSTVTITVDNNGSVNAVVFTATEQFRISNVVVTYIAED